LRDGGFRSLVDMRKTAKVI